MELVSLNYASSFMSLLTNGVIGIAINDTSYLLLSLVKDVVGHYPDLQNTTSKIDLHNKLIIIENFITIIPTHYEKIKCISTSLHSLHDSIVQIHNELSIINTIIEQHSSKYFSYWRTPTYYNNLDNLIKFKDLLDNRFDTLLKLINTMNILK